jgi:hypothetical protein
MGNTSTTDGRVNDRENRRGNQEWTIQRNLQHWLHNTQREDEQQQNTDKAKTMSNTNPTKL